MPAINFENIDKLSVNTMRMLAIDMIESAKSGHPGLPLGAAPMAYTIFRELNHNPANPNWFNRDRFILSAGHGSALLYSWLHLSGYGLTIDDLKAFRQLDSLTPGHPEFGHTIGVEATTGPLGHGFAMGVGLAIAQKFMAAKFNRPGFDIFNHYIYALVSDGDLMEGVSSEAASFAGTQALGNLIYLYDDNNITIEGSTNLSFNEDVRARFQAYGWQVIVVTNGENMSNIHQAIENARQEKDKPSLIIVKTKLGAGSPKEDTSSAHGEPLGSDNLIATKKFYNFPEDKSFYVPEEVQEHFKNITSEAVNKYENWLKLYNQYANENFELANELKRLFSSQLPESWETSLPDFEKDKKIATRASSGTVLNAIANELPELIGGSADLAPSNKTFLNGKGSFMPLDRSGRNIHFGVREAAMGAIMNGLSLYGSLIPYGGTFLVFSDFVRPAIRLAALMKLKTIYVFTHDSIGVGEDGPTHQPVEHLAALRAIPGLAVLRPADAYESSAAWKVAIKRQGPSALILSRQNLPVLHPADYPELPEGSTRGAYILSEAQNDTPEYIIIATGSEVQLALEAQKALKDFSIRVVSMPSWEIFQEQSAEYKEQVLPKHLHKRLAIEAGISQGWDKYIGDRGKMISVDNFGCSAPAEAIFQKFGFTLENITNILKSL